MPDIYDAEVERLSHATFLELCAAAPETRVGSSPLFDWCDDEPDDQTYEAFGVSSGCLMLIRVDTSCVAMRNRTPELELTAAIRADERIPTCLCDWRDWERITVEQRRARLTVLAEWQRAVSATIRQGKPWHNDFTPARSDGERDSRGFVIPEAADVVQTSDSRLFRAT